MTGETATIVNVKLKQILDTGKAKLIRFGKSTPLSLPNLFDGLHFYSNNAFLDPISGTQYMKKSDSGNISDLFVHYSKLKSFSMSIHQLDGTKSGDAENYRVRGDSPVSNFNMAYPRSEYSDNSIMFVFSHDINNKNIQLNAVQFGLKFEGLKISASGEPIAVVQIAAERLRVTSFQFISSLVSNQLFVPLNDDVMEFFKGASS